MPLSSNHAAPSLALKIQTLLRSNPTAAFQPAKHSSEKANEVFLQCISYTSVVSL